MILGAGIYQVPLIRTARRMGLYTIVVSIPGDYPGFALADKIYELNTRDKEAILAAAEKEQIDGICTSGTDVAVSTIGYVCEKMHLSGIPYEAAEILTDKAKMKDAFRQGGVSAADGMWVRSAEEAQKAAEQLGYPVVVKRVDSSGSRGITVVEHSGQIEEAYENARNGSARDYVLVEKFLRGTEIGVDGFVQNHKLVFLAPHTKICIPRRTHDRSGRPRISVWMQRGTAGRNCPPDAAGRHRIRCRSVLRQCGCLCGRREGLDH